MRKGDAQSLIVSTVPAAGTCEAGTATLLLQGDRGRSLELVAAGDICGQPVQPPFIVTQVFTGRYDIVSASQKRFLGDEGFFSVRERRHGQRLRHRHLSVEHAR